MSHTVEEVMPETSAAKEARFSVEAILTQLASKIIKHFIGSGGFVLEDGGKRILPTFPPVNQMEAIQVSMHGAKEQHHVAEACPGHLQVETTSNSKVWDDCGQELSLSVCVCVCVYVCVCVGVCVCRCVCV